MRRREFIAGLGGAAVWPMLATAQQAMPVIGFLNGASPEGYAPMAAAFRQGLKETGYVVGQNVVIEYRWAEGQLDRLPALAADLVRRQVTVIAATSIPAGPAAKAATTTIPIVFTTGTDPVASGLVTSLNRPGGNLTGVASMNTEVAPKRLELLHELLPTATVIGLLVNPTTSNVESQSRELQPVAQALGLQLDILHASTERDLDTVFSELQRLRVGALVVGGDPFVISRSEQVAKLALRHAIPMISSNREFTVAGGLMSYGGSFAETYHLAGVYTGRILNGEKPANLPIMQATKIELIINLKTAKALGLNVPQTLLAHADEVIE